jgi:excisionase family DNA binding protein
MNTRLYTIEEIAQILRVSTRKVRQMVEAGEIEHIMVGRQYRISEDQLQAFLDKQTRK